MDHDAFCQIFLTKKIVFVFFLVLLSVFKLPFFKFNALVSFFYY